MTKFIRIASLCLLLCMALGSCNQSDPDNDYDDAAFQEGVDYGMREIFEYLYTASDHSNERLLDWDEKWDTEDFSLTLTDDLNDGEVYLDYRLTLKNTTVDDSFRDRSFFFNIYSYDDYNDRIEYAILDYDNYSLANVLDADGHKLKDSIPVPNEVDHIIIIIVTEGNFYVAEYFVTALM